MRLPFLNSASNLVAWARSLVTALNQQEAANDARLKDIEARLSSGGL